MIIDVVRRDIFVSEHEHVVFAANTEGKNDSGFAGQVARRCWQGLFDAGKRSLGEVLKHHTPARSTLGGYQEPERTYYAVVCHSLYSGWGDAPRALEEGLESIGEAEKPLEVGAVLMGADVVGQVQGADPMQNMGALARSRHHITVYSL